MKSIELSSLRSISLKSVLSNAFLEYQVDSSHTGKNFLVEWYVTPLSQREIQALSYRVSTERFTLYLGDLDCLSELWFGSALTNADDFLQTWVLDLASRQLQKDLASSTFIKLEKFDASVDKISQEAEFKPTLHQITGHLHIKTVVNQSEQARFVQEEVDILKVLIHLHDQFALDYLVSLFSEVAHPFVNQHNESGLFQFSSFTLRVPIQIGALSSLPFEVGDVLLLSHSNMNGDGVVKIAMRSGHLLVCLNVEYPSYGEIILEQDPNSLLSLQNAWWDVPQELTVRAGSLTLSVQEILNLQNGQVLQIPNSDFPKVQIFNGDQEVAAGELVDCDGELAVQILRINHRLQGVENEEL